MVDKNISLFYVLIVYFNCQAEILLPLFLGSG